MIRLKWPGSVGRRAAGALLLWIASAGLSPAFAQLSTRLLLSSGMEVPGHGGLVYGSFSSLNMNGSQDIVFLTTLRSQRGETRAVVRSSGVSFSVVAFQGLLGPFPHSTYDSFSAPSINDGGVLAFTASLQTDQAGLPGMVVIRQVGTKARAVATSLDAPPGLGGAKFEEFSAPLVTSDGGVLFGGRWSGSNAGSGLFFSTSRGLQAVSLPAGLQLRSKELLEPFFFGHDEVAFIRRRIPAESAIDQFFRAIAIQSFQELQPPPDPGSAAQLLAPRIGAPPVQILVAYFENGNVQTALVAGDPAKPVITKVAPGASPLQAVGRIVSLTIGPRGNMVFAAAPAAAPNDLALYCDCDGQLNRLTAAEDFLPITVAGPGRPIASLSSDGQQTLAFIAPGASGDNTAIYVTTIH